MIVSKKELEKRQVLDPEKEKKLTQVREL